MPSLAVQTGQQGTYVFVVKPDQTVELRDGRSSSGRAATQSVIKSGLKPGETVVTDGQLRLVPAPRSASRTAQPAKATS